MDYGKELILDLHNCNASTFTRRSISKYFIHICKAIDMERADLHWWDDLYTPENERQTEEHLVGTSAIQFITTSNITIHTLNLLNKVFVNLFSCKDFDAELVERISASWFEGDVASSTILRRL